MSAEERRINKRCRLDIWIEQQTEKGELYFQHATNLSSGGLFVSRTVPLIPGTRVKLTFKLPGTAKTIKAVGEILAHHEDDGLGMGIRFVQIEEDDQIFIESWVDLQPDV
jgi:uncharacterized protein (TIGR02266 family)